jgi:hypothetical protein
MLELFGLLWLLLFLLPLAAIGLAACVGFFVFGLLLQIGWGLIKWGAAAALFVVAAVFLAAGGCAAAFVF